MGLFGRVIVGMMPLTPRFIIRWVAKRYVAGTDIASAIDLMSRMSSEGACFTVDVLGEDVESLEEAQFFMGEYIRLLDAIVENGLDANISIKPTAFGLLIDESVALANIEKLLRRAAEDDIFVRLDMESHKVTQATIDTALAMHSKGLTNIGVVLQGRLFRTPSDIIGVELSLIHI